MDTDKVHSCIIGDNKMTGLEANYIDSDTFTVVGNLTDILIAGRKIKADCGSHGFKFGTIASSSWSISYTTVNLTSDSDDITDKIEQIWYEAEPHMEDGRPVVRADTRPIDSETFFTDAGDSSDDIGDGVVMAWDFTDSTSDIYTGPEVPDGFKCKQILLTFHCPVHLKDGAIYFFDAPWGAYLEMDVVVPSGGYYPNPEGAIPASALGLSGNLMYAQASGNTRYQKYVNKHRIYGSCPMGDELNAEGAAVNPVPPGWYVRGLIFTPESDNVSKGFASLEMYRCHTCLLPGQTVSNIH